MFRILIASLAVCVCLVAAAGADDDPYSWRWYEIDSNNQVHVNLFVFYRLSCPHCKDGLQFADRLAKEPAWLNVVKYEISQHRGNFELYRRMAASLNRRAGTVPAFFYCKQLTLGYSSYRNSGRPIETRLNFCRDQLQKQLDAIAPKSSSLRPSFTAAVVAMTWRTSGLMSFASMAADFDTERPQSQNGETAQPHGRAPDIPADQPELEIPLNMPDPPPMEETVEVPFFGELQVNDLSLPAFTFIIAGCDAFNPCAFFILLTLLSLLMHAGSRWRMLIVGGIFVLFSGLFYFVFMAAWLNIFMLAGHIQWITVAAGLLAVVVAVINIKDYFAYRRGVSLSIPDKAKPGLFARMRKLVAATSLWPMLAGTLALAAAANMYELLCTAGFPMVFTRVLTLRELPASGYYGYLLFYNLVYVVPLAVIVFAFTVTLGTRKLQEREGRVLKLLSGTMMLLLGLVILLVPDLLHSVVAAVALLACSIAVTALVVLVDRLQGGWRRPAASR